MRIEQTCTLFLIHIEVKYNLAHIHKSTEKYKKKIDQDTAVQTKFCIGQTRYS